MDGGVGWGGGGTLGGPPWEGTGGGTLVWGGHLHSLKLIIND